VKGKLDTTPVFSDLKGGLIIFLVESGGYGVVLGSYLAQFTIFWAFLPSEWENKLWCIWPG
jgi:biotin transporter BioY